MGRHIYSRKVRLAFFIKVAVVAVLSYLVIGNTHILSYITHQAPDDQVAVARYTDRLDEQLVNKSMATRVNTGQLNKDAAVNVNRNQRGNESTLHEENTNGNIQAKEEDSSALDASFLWINRKNGSSSCSERSFTFDRRLHYNASLDKELLERCDKQRDKRKQSLSSYMPYIQDQIRVKTRCGDVMAKRVSVRGLSQEEMKRRLLTDAAVVVPNVIHYILFGAEFSFLNYLSFVSSHKYAEPRAILMHGSEPPYGRWWNRTTREVPNIYFVPHGTPERIQDRNIRFVPHVSDILRLQILLDNGGIYLDTDVLVLRSLNDLLQHGTTMAPSMSDTIANGVILTQPHSPYLCMLSHNYYDYDPQNWRENSVIATKKLYDVFPHLLNLEKRGSFYNPTVVNRRQLLLSGKVDWSQNYVMHIWKRADDIKDKVPKDVQSINTLNNTLGEVMRHVYYGSKDMLT